LHFLVVSSVHDYRMARRGSIQSLADGLRQTGAEVSFLSIRFSLLSRLTRDPRNFLWNRANRCEDHSGITCFIWKTPLHPARTGIPLLDRALRGSYAHYGQVPNAAMDALIGRADVVLLESGHAIALLPRVKRLNPSARIFYRASDRLDVIRAGETLQAMLRDSVNDVDGYLLISEKLLEDFDFARDKSHVLPLGLDKSLYDRTWPSPFKTGRPAAVSVGSMLFDLDMVTWAAQAHPQVDFHVIGSRVQPKARPDNLVFYDEMPFVETLPYVSNATIGLAPYRSTPGAHYLAQSSLKLLQFAYLRKPVVCPDFATGDLPGRYGYRSGDPASVVSAVGAALADRQVPRVHVPDWREITQRFLHILDRAESAASPGPAPVRSVDGAA
jgi:2-beta-glucuronyltransferase